MTEKSYMAYLDHRRELEILVAQAKMITEDLCGCAPSNKIEVVNNISSLICRLESEISFLNLETE